MGNVVIQYETRAARADENAELIEKVFAELNAAAPAGLRYASFRLEPAPDDDRVRFVHIAYTDGAGAEALAATPAFVAFQEQLADRLAAPLERRAARLIGSYGVHTS